MLRRQFIKSMTVWPVLGGLLQRRLGAKEPDSQRDNVASAAPERAPRFGDGRDWWFQHRFGFFIHWGLYSIHGWHEQEQWRRRIPRSDYVQLARQWNPTRFDPDQWLDAAERAGMTYVCFTTKHHDGFCLWNTKFTDYNCLNTPYGRDVLEQLAEACHRRRVPLCLYYSIADWHHPNYPNEGRHHELPPQPDDRPDLLKYVEYVRGQLRELCTQYGEIHGIWWDMNVGRHVDHSINAMIRQLQPNAVINNRGFDDGDFGTPERDFDQTTAFARTLGRRTEACQSVGSQSWGYRRDEDYYCDRHLLRSVDRYLARDANFLLNVGPKPDGTLPEEVQSILERIGGWFHATQESFDYTIPASHLTTNRAVLLTSKGRNVYVHLCEEPLMDAVILKPIRELPLRATLLNTGQSVAFSNEMTPSEHENQIGFLRLHHLPGSEMSNTVMVIKLEFDQPLFQRVPRISRTSSEEAFQADGSGSVV